MSFKQIVAMVIFVSVSISCGGNDNESNTDSGTSSPAEEILPWSAVSYTWRSNWVECTDNQLTINRNKQISSNSCGDMQGKTITDEDFRKLEKQIAPVLQNVGAEFKCKNEAIMDYAVTTYINANGRNIKMYSYDERSKCSRGDTAQAEQLTDLLGVLHDKYLPSAEPTAE